MAHSMIRNGGLQHAKYGVPLVRQHNGSGVIEAENPDELKAVYSYSDSRRLSAKEQRTKSRARTKGSRISRW